MLLLLIIIPLDVCNAMGLKLEQESVGDNEVSLLVKYTKNPSEADFKFVDFSFAVKYSKAKFVLKSADILLKGDWKSSKINDSIRYYCMQSADAFKKNDENLVRLTFEYSQEKEKIYGSEIGLESITLMDATNDLYTADKSFLTLKEADVNSIDKIMIAKCAFGVIVVLLGIKVILNKMYGNSITSTELQKMDDKYKKKMYSDVPTDINKNIRQ
jgi:hypothetical protein